MNEDVLFLKELFDIDDIQINHLPSTRQYDIYMTGCLVLWSRFDGETLTIAKPESMNVEKKFVINDKNIPKIKKCIEELWVENYANLAKDD